MNAGPDRRDGDPPGPRADWYQDAVFYELPVKSFFDSNADGIGDFRGLTSKLDYLQELGVTCLWLLPFFPSPLRDDGYDVVDYRAVHPSLGTMDDFRDFLAEAHRRGLRVAAEMVVNHTSDQHPWFQAARAAPEGSPLRDFYVWSKTPDRFAEAQVLHSVSKRSNWTWDRQAEAFYWHRFFDHQPDLNYQNPAVQDEMLKVLRFWADEGIDGLCLNGAAYLVEMEGTGCEHLPQTHAILKQFCRELKSNYPELMLQAGLNAWPADAALYFGNGDECNMAPQLALAQRIFLAVRQEDRRPIANLLEQTPDLPAGCQWVTLLRNHDELTLSLATDEERDYLFREYASEGSMRLHDGILRRLAPLASNNRRRIELLFGLLFSLPGAPLVYYGDEIGMGDNVFMASRNGVRTPMQWAADRNAGFSSADFARLYCPPVMDPLYGHQAVNVATQQRDTSSLLHWIRRIIALRKRYPTMSRGRCEFLHPRNRKAIAFVRRLTADSGSDGSPAAREEPILVVANLSRVAQPVELDLGEYAGLIPVEMFGRSPFPRIGSSPYLITLAPHAFFWFQLRTSATDVATRLAPVETEAVERVPVIDVGHDFAHVLDSPAREQLEQHVLPAFLRSQRWFGGKARQIQSTRILDSGPLDAQQVQAYLVLVEVTFVGDTRDVYFLPMGIVHGEEAVPLYETMRPWVIARLHGAEQDGVLFDALADDSICTAFLTAIGEGRTATLQQGTVGASPTSVFGQLTGGAPTPLPVVRGPATSSNSIVFFGRRLLLKLFRRLERGINPDYEVGRFLTERHQFRRIPQVAGSLEYRPTENDQPYSLGILQAFVANQGDGWRHAIDELSRYYERASARMYAPDQLEPDPRPLTELIHAPPPPVALETIATYLYAAATLGRRTAEMHLAMAADPGEPAFAPEPLTGADMDSLRKEIDHQRQLAFSALSDNLSRLPPTIAPEAQRLLTDGPALLDHLAARWTGVPQATKTRIHGDYHLGQVLWVDNDYIILDFEGEPTRSVDERREKFSPIRDVAGMLRSYHYAAYAGLFAFTQDRPDDFARLAPWAELWQQWVSAAFLRQYLATAGEASFMPRDNEEFRALLDGYMLAKALYELVYELNNRPDWVRIPLGGVLALLAAPAAAEQR